MNAKRKVSALNKEQIAFIKGCSTLQKAVWRLTYLDPLKSFENKISINKLKKVTLLLIAIREKIKKNRLKTAIEKWLQKSKLMSNLIANRRVQLKKFIFNKETKNKFKLSKYLQKWKNTCVFSEKDILKKYGAIFKLLDALKKKKLKDLKKEFLLKTKKYINRENKPAIKNLLRVYKNAKKNILKRALQQWKININNDYILMLKRKLFRVVVIYSLRKNSREKLNKALKKWYNNVKNVNFKQYMLGHKILSIYGKWNKYNNNLSLLSKLSKWRNNVTKNNLKNDLKKAKLKKFLNKKQKLKNYCVRSKLRNWYDKINKLNNKEKQKKLILKMIIKKQTIITVLKNTNNRLLQLLKNFNIWKKNVNDAKKLDENIIKASKILSKLFSKPFFDKLKEKQKRKINIDKSRVLLRSYFKNKQHDLIHWWFSTWRKNARTLSKIENNNKTQDIYKNITLINLFKKINKINNTLNRGKIGKYLYKWKSNSAKVDKNNYKLLKAVNKGSEILQNYVFRTTHPNILHAFNKKVINNSITNLLPKIIKLFDKNNKKNILKTYLLKWKSNIKDKGQLKKLKNLFEKYLLSERARKKLFSPYSIIVKTLKNYSIDRKHYISSIAHFVHELKKFPKQIDTMKKRILLSKIFKKYCRDNKKLKLKAAFADWARRTRALKAVEKSTIIQKYVLKNLRKYNKRKKLNDILRKYLLKKEADNKKKLKDIFNKWYNILPLLRKENAALLITAFLRGINVRKKFNKKDKLNKILLNIISKNLNRNYLAPSFYKWCKNAKKSYQIDKSTIIQNFCKKYKRKNLKNAAQDKLNHLFKKCIFKDIARALKLKYILSKLLDKKNNNSKSLLDAAFHKWSKLAQMKKCNYNSTTIQNFSKKLKDLIERKKLKKLKKVEDFVNQLQNLLNKKRKEILDKIKKYINNLILSKLLALRKKLMDRILRQKLLQWKSNVYNLGLLNSILRLLLRNYYLKRKLLKSYYLRKWLDRAKQIDACRIAKNLGNLYKIAIARQKWKYLADKLRFKNYNKNTKDIINNIKKRFLINNLLKDLNNKIKNDGIKQLKDGNKWMKKLQVLRNYIGKQDKNYLRLYLKRWKDKIKKLKDRDLLLNNALKKVNKRQLINDAKKLTNASKAAKIVRAIPVARANNFLKNLKNKYDKSKNDLYLERNKAIKKLFSKKDDLNKKLLKEKFDKWAKIAKNFKIICAKKIAKWTENQYKFANARKNWKDLSKKYYMFINQKLLNNIIKRLKKNLALRNMKNKLKNKFTKVANDQFNKGIKFKKLLNIMKNIFNNFEKRKKLLTLKHYLKKWSDKAKKLKNRENLIKNSFNIFDKNMKTNSANIIKNACIVKCVKKSLPVARVYDFLDRLRNLSEHTLLGNHLVSARDEVKANTKYDLLRKLYKMYYYKILEKMFDRIQNIEEKNKTRNKKYFIQKFKTLYKKEKKIDSEDLKKLLKKYFIKYITNSLQKPSKVYKCIYLIKLTLMHRAISCQRYVKEIIRKWRFSTFARNLARIKLENIYKNLQNSYLYMMNKTIGSKEFEEFADKLGMWTNEDYKIPSTDNFCEKIKKKYIFQQNLSLSKDSPLQLLWSGSNGEDSDINNLDFYLDQQIPGESSVKYQETSKSSSWLDRRHFK